MAHLLGAWCFSSLLARCMHASSLRFEDRRFVAIRFENLLPDVSFVSFSLRVAPVSRGLLVGVPGVADLGAELFAV